MRDKKYYRIGEVDRIVCGIFEERTGEFIIDKKEVGAGCCSNYELVRLVDSEEIDKMIEPIVGESLWERIMGYFVK